MDRSAWWGLGIAAALIVAGLAWYRFGWLERQEAPPELELFEIEEPQAPPEPRYPVPVPEVDDEADEEVAGGEEPRRPALPALADSDGAVAAELENLFGRDRVRPSLIPRRVVDRIVMTVDSLDREPTPLRQWPTQHIEGVPEVRVEAEGTDDETIWWTDNSERYRPWVRAFTAVDAERFAAVYVHHYPLFQQAWSGLGYPDRHFNDRLIEIIDHLLMTPRVEGPIRLVQPKVLYRFADPELEALSWGQKQMIRLGPENAEQVRATLRRLRAAILAEIGAAPED